MCRALLSARMRPSKADDVDCPKDYKFVFCGQKFVFRGHVLKVTVDVSYFPPNTPPNETEVVHALHPELQHACRGPKPRQSSSQTGSGREI